ncbi:MAG: 5'/3'-nucleotidase SurE [Bacteroidales bacterium]|nr:5'/3'-nucleotidase SurE [Bacteroidales bacterium]MDD4670190.1 5'/3'-nucleotidase SurE [Bacteroidales bacterium]
MNTCLKNKTVRDILVVNDDGIKSKGLVELATLAREFGNVTVIAPATPQSGKSASITLDAPLRLKKISDTEATDRLHAIRFFSLSGTPVDCAKMGMNLFIEEGGMPDLLLSGFNHGSNASVASVYSGTLGAAAEGTIYGVPSLGFSINTHNLKADFAAAIYFSRKIIELYMNTGIKPGVYLNVNIPNLPQNDIKGIKMAHQGYGRWVREFEKRTDPHKKDYYWMVGSFYDLEEAGSVRGDHKVVDDAFVSIVPHSVDNTDYEEMNRLKNIWHLE